MTSPIRRDAQRRADGVSEVDWALAQSDSLSSLESEVKSLLPAGWSTRLWEAMSRVKVQRASKTKAKIEAYGNIKTDESWEVSSPTSLEKGKGLGSFKSAMAKADSEAAAKEAAPQAPKNNGDAEIKARYKAAVAALQKIKDLAGKRIKLTKEFSDVDTFVEVTVDGRTTYSYDPVEDEWDEGKGLKSLISQINKDIKKGPKF